MADEVTDLSGHILAEIHRIHDSHDRIYDKLSEQGETLLRNTISLEDHVKRTNLLEEKMVSVGTEVDSLKVTVNKFNFIYNILKPTKEKIKWVIVIISILSGSYGTYQLSNQGLFGKAIKTIERVILE